MIVRVEEAAIVDHERHLVSLMHDLEIAIPVYWRDLHFLIVLRQYFPLVLEVIDKLLWCHILDFHLTNVEGMAIVLPPLVLH